MVIKQLDVFVVECEKSFPRKMHEHRRVSRKQYDRARHIAKKNVDVDVMMLLKKVGKLQVRIDLNLPDEVIKQQCEVFYASGTGDTDIVSTFCFSFVGKMLFKSVSLSSIREERYG